MDFYEYLEIKPTATPQEIQAAFRKKAKQTHPDYNKKDTAFYEMVELNIAYETLINPKKRSEYDNLRLHAQKTESTVPPKNSHNNKPSIISHIRTIFTYRCKVCSHELTSTWKGYCLYHYLEATQQLNNEDFIFMYNGQKYQWQDPPEHLRPQETKEEKIHTQYNVTKVHYVIFILLTIVIIIAAYAIFNQIIPNWRGFLLY